MIRVFPLVIAAACLLGGATRALSQDTYPSHPIKILVGFRIDFGLISHGFGLISVVTGLIALHDFLGRSIS